MKKLHQNMSDRRVTFDANENRCRVTISVYVARCKQTHAVLFPCVLRRAVEDAQSGRDDQTPGHGLGLVLCGAAGDVRSKQHGLVLSRRYGRVLEIHRVQPVPQTRPLFGLV
jgi:hypothetical protein